MLPPSLKGVYQKYKADTDLVAEWLAVTAKAHGYAAATASPAKNPPSATGGRLKGKARKLAKAAAASKAPQTTAAILGASPGTASNGAKTTYLVKMKEFEPMAAFISEVGDIQIPGYVSVALERVIRVRKNFSERLAGNGVRINSISTDRHSFFVEVLEKVRHHLKPRMGAIPFNDEEATRADAKSGGLVNNVFGALEVYHTSTEFQNAPDAAVPTPAAGAKYVAEQGDAAMDIVFAFIALLDDYNRLRIEIKSLWADYTSGHLDLAAVSVATNTAFEIARDMEEEVEPLFGKLGGGAFIANQYFSSLCRALGITMEAKKHPGDLYNLEAYDLADSCMMNTLTMLISYLQSTGRTDIHLQSYNGSFGWYDEKLGASSRTNQQKWKQDMTAMLELMPDVSFLAWKLGGASVVDEITRGMAYLMDEPTKVVPVWLAWATQIYLDILQSLGDGCDCGFQQLQQETLKIKHSMLNIPASSKERSQVLSAASRWDEDPIWTTRKTMADLGLLPNAIAPPFKFLRRNPMYCGLLIHHMRATLHSSGGPYAATPGALLGATQLYHALRQEKLLADDLVWDDLETLWKMQGNASFFVGEPPTNREAYFKNYCLSIGTSATNWASDRRKGKLRINSANRRNLKFMGYLSLATNHRLEHPGARQPWSSAAVEDLLNQGIRKQYTDSREHFQIEFKDRVEEAILEHAGLLTPELIRKLALGIQSEIPGICFNFFTMHNEAWTLLGRLKEGFRAILGGAAYPGTPDDLPLVAGLVFAVAAGQMSPQGDKKMEESDVLMHAAAAILQKFLEEGKGSAIKQAATKTLQLKDVEDLEFESHDPWGIEKLNQVSQFL